MTIPSVPEAVLFDMDGTLIDSEHIWLAAEVAVMKRMGSDWTTDDQEFCLGGPLERVADYMVRRSGAGLTAEEMGQLLLDEVEHRMRTEPLMWQPGGREILGECLTLGLPTALVTSSWFRLVQALEERIAEAFGRDPFSAVIAGDHVSNSKPHPEPYLLGADAVGAAIEWCLAVEDSPTGVASAIAAGCKVIAVPHLASVTHLTAGYAGAVEIDTLAGRDLRGLWNLVC